MDDSVRERDKLRLEVLRKVYDLSGGDTSQYVNGGVLAQGLRLMDDSKTLKAAVDYLAGEGLVDPFGKKFQGVPGLLKLTHAGLKEIEQSNREPEKPTEHLPAQNIYVGSMTNSTILQGTNSTQTSTQMVTLTLGAKQKLLEFVRQGEHELPALGLEAVALGEAKAELATIKAQAESPKPRTSVIRGSLTAIQHVLEHAGGAVVGHTLIKHIPTLLALLG